jgi:single-strand DNA-binding protein
MAGETVITVVGNLVDDPELRFTPAGAAVAKFRIASTPRVFDKTANEWKDGDSLFLTCSVWRQAAENAAESLARGVRVIVQGRLKQRSYEDREGVKRTVYEIDVDEVGPTLARATAKVEKNPAGGGQRQAGDARAGGNASPDPWANAQPANGQQQGGGWGSAPAGQQQPAGHPEEAPF